MKVILLIMSALFMAGWITACTTTGSELSAAPPAAVNQAEMTILTPAPIVTDSGATTVFTPVPTATRPSKRHVEHSGISLSYEPALLGEINIEDIPASADQGLFGLPTPAHTWLGFAPAGTVPDSRIIHWNLMIEPQVLVFNLSDFGSFAVSDAIARERIAAFQQLMSEQPSTFSGEVPILPLVNAAQAMQAQVKWLDFEEGVGVRFVTTLTQEVIPVANDRLVYIFYGMTGDGLHGVTAVLPLTAATLPDTAPMLSEADITALNENYEAEMIAVTDRLNDLAGSHFNPMLSKLDALVQSITIVPAETDYAVTAVAPQNAQLIADITIVSSPGGDTRLGILSAGDAVVINGQSIDGRYGRILCTDGSTGNCWLSRDALQVTDTSGSEMGKTGGPVDGQVMQIQALLENVVFAAPSETAAQLGALRVGEAVEVFTADASGVWYNISCPRNIGVNCWVIADAVVNEPVSFFSSDDWKPVTGEYADFRVPIEWKPTSVSPEGGAVLEAWTLGIPGVDSDQDVAFSAVPFEDLKPADVQREMPFEIGGHPGEKWVRSGQGYVSYDYYTTGTAGAGSFGIHVTVPEADPKLEATLDKVAASVAFWQPEGEAADSEPRFDRYVPITGQEVGSSLVGLVQQGAGWQVVSVPYPTNTYAADSDYAPATDRLLAWRTSDGAGPASLAAGPLSVVDLATGTEHMVVPDDVISAGWAPNGLDFAYILGTPETYELHWLAYPGEDKLLAVDVPHSLRVSPDGRHVAFTRESHYGLNSAVPGLYVVEIETGKETQLSTMDRAGYGGLYPFWKPLWSPDSSQVLLYTAADSDRAAVPHPSGYVWASVDGSFSHFLPDSEFLAYFDQPLSAPENRPCLGGPPLFSADQLVFRVGECRPMSIELETAMIINFALDEETGAITVQQALSEPATIELLAWDVPGESVLLYQDGAVTKLFLQ